MTDKRASLKPLRFKWSGIGTDGATLSGELVAPSEVRARMALRQQGITPTRVDRSRRHATRLPAKTVAFFLRQLATLIRSGVPILSAFDIIARSQDRPEATQILLQIRTDLQTGTSLATALTRHPANFDELTCTLVAAGEQSGLLDVMLARIADYQEKMLAIRSKLRSALTYPIAILSVAAIVTILMLVYVVPAFESTFSSFGAALPLPTRIIIDGSAALRDYGLILALGCSVITAGLIHQWRNNIRWHEATDRWLLTLPIMGSLLRRAALARWCRTLASLYGAGIPLLESLTPAGNATGNRLYQQASQALCQKVSQGDNLSRALARQSVFSPLLVQMVGIGEESGTLDEMLNKVADIYDREVNDTVTQLGTLMEPLLMILLGGIIGGLVIAMYLPIFQLGTVL